MPTKGLVVSKQKQEFKEGDNMEGSSVDSPHQEIARLVSTMVEGDRSLPAEGEIIPASLCPSVAPHFPDRTRGHCGTISDTVPQAGLGTPCSPPIAFASLPHCRTRRSPLAEALGPVRSLPGAYIGFFGNVLADILEICYPQLMTTNML